MTALDLCQTLSEMVGARDGLLCEYEYVSESQNELGEYVPAYYMLKVYDKRHCHYSTVIFDPMTEKPNEFVSIYYRQLIHTLKQVHK